MAYDANTAYKPPPRAYYGQRQEQEPSQQPTGYAVQGEYDSRGRSPYADPYDQRYPLDQGHAQGIGYGGNINSYQNNVEQYGNGYTGGYPGATPRPTSGDRLGQQQAQRAQYEEPPQAQFQQHVQSAQSQPQFDRNYDPRFQQRPGRVGSPGYGRPPGQRQPEPNRQPLQQDRQQARASPDRQGYQSTQHRAAPPQSGNGASRQPQPEPRNNYLPQQQPSRTQRPAETQPNGQRPPPRRQDGPAAHQAPPAVMPEFKKLTMVEWKAQEKAKLHQGPVSPDFLAQDNAFPTFPNLKKDRMRPDDRSGSASRASGRSSEDLPPRTCATPNTQHSGEPRLNGQRPAPLRGNSNHSEQPPTQLGVSPQPRPSLDHKPFSYEPNANRQDPAHSSAPRQMTQDRPMYDRRPSGQQASQLRMLDRMDERTQQEYRRTPPQEDRRGSPQAQDYRQTPPPQNHSAYRYSPSPQQLPAPAQPQPAPRGARPTVPTIDTTQTRPLQTSASNDRQPFSPAYVSGRLSGTQGSPSVVSNLHMVQSASSQMSFSQTPTGYAEGGETTVNSYPHHPRTASHDIGKVYDDYHERSTIEPKTPQSAAPRSAAEIEADMPDFDSAAPEQTSMLHKRSQKGRGQPNHRPNEQAPPPMPTSPMRLQQAEQYASPIDNPEPGQYQVRNGQDPQTTLANPGAGKASLAHAGFDFGVGSQQPQYQYDDRQRAPPMRPPQPPYAQEPPVRRSMDEYGQRVPQMRPPQPPFVQEPAVRRSMDDARQMPYRQGELPGPRFGANSQPPRTQISPQQRPHVQRDYSAQSSQSAWSHPGQQRMGSAPPLRQGLQEPPPPQESGAPLSQQRSAPEQQEQHRSSNPDALPHHPVPVRPGLAESSPQPAKPPPVRVYDNVSTTTNGQTTRPASSEKPAQPVTRQELEQLGAQLSANPGDNKLALKLAKKLVEAASVLASDGGRADAKTTAKNRERYILDAHKRIKKLASAGYPDAQFYLADCYGQGSLGLEVDTKEAFNLYQAAAKQGHAQAAYRTAVCCEMGPEEGGGTRKDFAKALQWYRRAAALGETAAMYKLGMILLKSLLGQQRNVGEAVIWLKRAAERADHENPHALHELGTLYDSTNTDREVRVKIIADNAYALSLFKQAAGLGYKFSQFRLGQAFEYGTLGVPMDNRTSIQWYSKAAAQGEHQAELALSGWYLTGAEGILQPSDTEAYLWARKAAQSEPPLAKAMFAMGYFSEVGIGCPANVEEARRWYGRAASYKFPRALERLEELKKSGKARPTPVNGKLTRKDQKRDEAECTIM
ncbi:hypothetical protein BAUCODRAFT_35738 [Baudoinia panamericana UAMH 10762]|uniref:HCP-like protein n=1 Tax=Baudoinia panamericana (strain UAMH 10762) TaxID=717646 RepID=M2MSP9_BAUPA|nr:uncharacterized protein BAUCODRAFT_35738 [Baudoinia panamericana UAMH 10762]EMC94518.1 hypothetical protein BAUCODRAFT_35738 [Baudoinia panamericana UAMH 10762]